MGNGTANHQVNKSESPEEFEQWIFGPRGNSKTDAILDKLNLHQARIRDRSAGNGWMGNSKTDAILDKLNQHKLERSFNTLSDGMDGKLNNAAKYFEFDPNEIGKDDYSYRCDTTFHQGSKYDPKDLDLKKPAPQKYAIRGEFIVSTKEVLSQADFRVSTSVRVVLL
ncbi:hypothetical protein TSUD_347570 [Trifolium subterraneum]|nr:hypothetical protein TSUD_347570 [Trifolium subterraneum]